MRHEVLADQVGIRQVRERSESQPGIFDRSERKNHNAIVRHRHRLLGTKLL